MTSPSDLAASVLELERCGLSLATLSSIDQGRSIERRRILAILNHHLSLHRGSWILRQVIADINSCSPPSSSLP